MEDLLIVNGLFINSKHKDKLIAGNWNIESKNGKITCFLKDENTSIRYQVFSNGFFKLSKINTDSKWITIKKGWVKKPNKKEEFTGLITLPSKFDYTKFSCKLLKNRCASN